MASTTTNPPARDPASPGFTYSERDEDDDESELFEFDTLPGLGVWTKYSGPEERPTAKGSRTSAKRQRIAQEKAKVAEEEKRKENVAMGASPDGIFRSCPPMTGKIKNQYSIRKSVKEALDDCGDDEELKKCVIAATECEEYKAGRNVPSSLLAALCVLTGSQKAQSQCRFPSCGKVNVRSDRAKEHARVHIGNHPFQCTRVQADGVTIGCGATFLRKHDRNRHNNGADVLICGDCGANIQGKGREYNLQRHKSNYCPKRMLKINGQDDAMASGSASATSNGMAGPSQAQQHLLQNELTQSNGVGGSLHNSIISSIPMPASLQVHGPIPASSATLLPLDLSMGVEGATGEV